MKWESELGRCWKVWDGIPPEDWSSIPDIHKTGSKEFQLCFDVPIRRTDFGSLKYTCHYWGKDYTKRTHAQKEAERLYKNQDEFKKILVDIMKTYNYDLSLLD